MSSITTKRGDDGQTDMLFGCRVKKDYPRIDAIGVIDELNAALGLLRVTAQSRWVQLQVPDLQLTLINFMGELATPIGKEAQWQERYGVDLIANKLPELDLTVQQLEASGQIKFEGWALPGAAGAIAGAYADMARTICRRGERALVALEGTAEEVKNPVLIQYLNRLSDVLWLYARLEEQPNLQEFQQSFKPEA